VLGVLPWLHGLHLDAEDALPRTTPTETDAALRVVVPALPRIANHTDFDPLRRHPQVRFEFVGPGRPIPPADLMVLPGSKSVRSDLEWLRAQGWEPAIRRHLRYGGRLIGICGGFQMLGEAIHDPQGLEGPPGSSRGLGLLAMQTTLAPTKRLRNQSGHLAFGDRAPVTGYEIHAGISEGPALAHPALMLEDGPDGALDPDGQILGTYLHGLFESPAACTALLRWAGLERPQTLDHAALREAAIERLADAIETHLDTARLRELVEVPA